MAPTVQLIEPYHGESHARLVDGMVRRLPFDFRLLTMTPRKWKWRMRGAALWAADVLAGVLPAEVLFASAYLALPEFLALGPAWVRDALKVVYFHENQFVYPARLERKWDFHFAMCNVTTALAADRVAFNSAYNRDSFLGAIPGFLKKFPDYRPERVAERIAVRSRVLPVPLEPEEFTGLPRPARAGPARILWNHRWEHDKNPEEFFEALFRLADAGVPFEVAVAGESFAERPPVFDAARARLGPRVVHWGFVDSRRAYLELAASCDLVVSTALHEFFGVAVLEAVRAGCFPVLPDRLSYPELFPAGHLYREGGLVEALGRRIEAIDAVRGQDLRGLAARYEWPAWEPGYRALLER